MWLIHDYGLETGKSSRMSGEAGRKDSSEAEEPVHQVLSLQLREIVE